MNENIFETNFRLPDTVYIIGTGPNGREGWAYIPKDSYVITCNKANMIPYVYSTPWKSSMMLIGDIHCSEEEWFEPCYESAELTAWPKQVTETGWIPDYEWLQTLSTSHLENNPVWGNIRSGMSVIGVALQLVYHFGNKAVLCGADMAGNGRFSGEEPYTNGHWDKYCKRLRLFINTYLPERVFTLTPSKLKLKKYR